MKNFILMCALTFSLQSLAHVHYRAGDEAVPTPKRAQTAKQCFSEALSSGCGHPRENREEFRLCVRDQVGSFSPDCQAFITRLYGKGN